MFLLACNYYRVTFCNVYVENSTMVLEKNEFESSNLDSLMVAEKAAENELKTAAGTTNSCELMDVIVLFPLLVY